MKILATKQRLAPTTVRVGYMKHYFFCAFLSLFLLSGCGGSSGGGDSTSSSKKAKAAKACTTPIPNGKGELPWNTKTKKYSTTCKVVSCNAGYVKNTEGNSCDGKTKACMTPIPNGKGELPWNTKTKKYSTTCKVVSCNAGYVKNTGENTCDIPDTGKYADSSGDEQSCDAITLDPGGFNTFLLNTGAVETATDCGFSCNAGFLKSGRACNFPRKGKYVAGSGSEGSCGDVGGTLGGFNEFLNNIKGVNTPNGCNFSCKQNHVKSASDYTCIQGTSCSVANGEGLRRTSPGSCKVVDCNAGYDSVANQARCGQTPSGFFSLADDKTRTTCPAPQNSSPTSTTRLSSADGCYTCDGGYLKNTASNTCDFPSKGKYVDASGTEVTCNPITTLQGGAIATWIGGAAADSAITCPFSCSAGFVKTGRACNIPDTGNYADGAGGMQSCSTPTGGFNTFLPNTGAVETATDCDFSCNAGFLKNTGANTCPIPSLGKYADGSGNEQSCDNPTGATGGFKEFLTNTAAVATATGCNFSCNVGFVKNTADSMCEIPDLGKYADSSGDEQSCNNPTGAASGFDVFLPNTGAVSTATGCGFSCNAGYMKDSSARECNYPTPGTYVNGGTESSCDSITSITAEGAAVATWIAGAASMANSCPFSCTPGYSKDSSARACNYPTPGTYADAQGAEVSCTDIMSMTGFGSWVSGAATDADSCPFSCASGYTVSGRACRKPKMLALGEDTSRILFDNGEVEAWGKVSTSPWRSHIKENLGGNTPQALVSGDYHQCIILENSGQNHGRLMCWGANGDEQLGVGDTINKTTPTAVTVLGNDGDGDPYTVKSVAAGGAHTCALLNDDTVKCWGHNSSGQIGGGPGSTNTISGLAGDPLRGGTASRISAGGSHTCAVLSDKSVQCWGRNNYGQTGGGAPSLGVNKTATEIAMGQVFSCAILNDNTVKCWGGVGQARYIGVGGVPNLGGGTATGIALGSWHACALLNDKTVKCWGNNLSGQLGGLDADPSRVLRGASGDPLGGQTAIKIVAGSAHTCAIMESDHSVKCWGLNVDIYETGFYGQIVGEVAMTGGTNGTGTSTGETATLTTASTPTATALDSDANGKVCGLALASGAILINKDYNSGGSATISAVIDSMISAIGSSVTMGGTNITLTRKGTNKIEATVNSAVFEGMTLTIYHDDNGGDCTTTKVGTNILITGGSGAAIATGLWIISEDYSGLGDKTINLDSVHIDLGNTGLSKEDIADKIVADVTGGSWVGRQNVDLPYTATKLDGSSNTNDGCPTNDFCVVFNRLFKGTEGNYGIPFGDRDYGGAFVLMTGGSDGTGTSTGETQTLAASSTPTAIALEEDAGGQICKITLSGGTLGSPWIAKNYTTPLTYNGGGSTAITDAIDNLITAISPPVNIAGTNVTLSKTGTDKIAATTNTAVFEGMTLTIFHDDDGEDCTTSPVATEISLSGASGAAIATGLWVISHDFISGSGDKTINLDSVDIDLGNTDLSKEDIADKIVGEVTGGSWAGTQYEDLPYTATKVQNSDNSDCPSSDYCVEFTRVFAGSEGNDGIPLWDRDYSH